MAVIGIVGLQGAGKTAFAVRTMYHTRKQQPGRRIVSNTPIYLPGEPVRVVDRVEQCFGLCNCELLLDEIHLWVGARQWKRHGEEYAEWISQLRKRGVNLWYTAQSMRLVDALVREQTFMQYVLESFRVAGFMWWRAYSSGEVRPRKEDFYRSGWYFLNEKILRLYDTDFLVKL